MHPDAVGALTGSWNRETAAMPGDVSVQLRAFNGAMAGLRVESAHYAASTMKLTVLAAALREMAAGRLDLGEELDVRATFASVVADDFTLLQTDDQDDATWQRLGSRLPVALLLDRMITDSSNIATNILMDRLGVDAVSSIATHVAPRDLSVRRLIGDERAEAAGVTNTVTAHGLSTLVALLAGGSLLPEEPTHWALNLMARQKHRGMIPAGLPPGTWSASKSGWSAAVNHDVALVRPAQAPSYILAVCTTTGLGSTAEQLVARLSRITWEHWTTWHAS